MTEIEKAREQDLAWAEHRREQPNQIPDAIKRAVRNFKKTLDESNRRATTMVNSGSWKASARLVFSNSPRPAKAFEHLRRTLAPARVERASVGAIDGITATWLEAFDGSIIVGVDHPSLRQSEVIVNLFSIVAGLSYVTNTPLAVPDHALGRMLMRSPKIDLSAAIHEACAHFLKAPFQTVADMALAGQTVVLPAGDGYLLTEAIFPDVLGKTRVPVARARTFILKSQAGLDQLPIAPASSSELGVLAGTWQLLGAVPGTPPLLRPDQLERLAENSS